MVRETAPLIIYTLIHASFVPTAWAQTVPTTNFVAHVSGNVSAAAGSMAGLQGAGKFSVLPAVSAISADPTALFAPSTIPSLPISVLSAPTVSADPLLRISLRFAGDSVGPVASGITLPEFSRGAPLQERLPLPTEQTVETSIIESGLQTTAVGRRVTSRFTEIIKNVFGLKSAQSADFPDAQAVAADHQPPSLPGNGLLRSTPEVLKPQFQSGGTRAPATEVGASGLRASRWRFYLNLPFYPVYLLTVVPHEAAHWIAARSLGGRQVRLKIFATGGGFVEYEGPLSPRRHAIIALAGPLTGIMVGTGIIAAAVVLGPYTTVAGFVALAAGTTIIATNAIGGASDWQGAAAYLREAKTPTDVARTRMAPATRSYAPHP